MTDKHLISISDFANVGPVNQAYPQTYKEKNCFFCDKDATKIALFEIDNVVARRLYCEKHIQRLKK